MPTLASLSSTSSYSEILQSTTTLSRHQLSGTLCLYQPVTRINFQSKAFSITAPVVWNSLSPVTRKFHYHHHFQGTSENWTVLCCIRHGLTFLQPAKVKKEDKGRYISLWEPHLRATGCHLPYGITQCYLPPDTSERAPPNPSHAGWYSIYLPLRDGRLSWPSWPDSTPAGSRTSDLSITSPTSNRCTTKITYAYYLNSRHTAPPINVFDIWHRCFFYQAFTSLLIVGINA